MTEGTLLVVVVGVGRWRRCRVGEVRVLMVLLMVGLMVPGSYGGERGECRSRGGGGDSTGRR